MSKFAATTKVSTQKTLGDIQATLAKYGAKKFAYFEDSKKVGIGFEMNNRQIRFILKLPDIKEYEKTPAGQKRYDKSNIEQHYKQGIKQRWRALLLAIKSKLESVECEIETFDEAFMAQIVLPNGTTVGEWGLPQIERTYADGKMPKLLGHME